MSDLYVKQEIDRVFVDPARDPARSVLEMTWFRNILYYLGEQWLSWFEESRTFGRRYTLTGNVPTPVSNIIKDYVRSTKALVLNKKYQSRVWPNSRERMDIEAAELAQQALIWMDSLDDYDILDTQEWVAMWMILTGSGFCRTFAEVNDGVFLGDSRVGTGKVATEHLLPFNVVVAPLGTKLEKKAFVGIKSLKSKEWVEDTFKTLVQVDEGEKRLVDYERQLLQLVANVSPWKFHGVEQTVEDVQEELVLFREIEYRPTSQFKEGRYYAMAGDQVVKKVDVMPIKSDTKTGGWDYSITHFPYNFTPGSFWPTGGVDDLISPQNTINEIDQGLSINRKSLGRPMILSPAQLTLRRMSERGQALLAVEYDARNSGGAKPEIHSGVPLPEQVLKERDVQRGVAQDAGGDPKNILRGQSPTSGASGVMVDTLREAAESSHSPDIQRFYRNWGKVQRKRLTVAQSLFTETRMLKIPGEGNKIKIRAFKGSDLRGNTDVRLELDSGMSSTQAGKNEIFLKLLQYGFFGDLVLQPRMRREIAKRMGMGTLPDEDNLHQDKAEKENSIFAFGGDDEIKGVALPNAPIPGEDGAPIIDEQTGEIIALFPKTYDPTFRYDNHVVHAKVLLEFILSSEFPDLPRERQMWARAHLDMHQAALEAIEEENNQKMAEKAAMGITEPGGGGAPPAPPSAPMAGPQGMMPEAQQGGESGGTAGRTAGNY
jgi:hypothetical protein